MEKDADERYRAAKKTSILRYFPRWLTGRFIDHPQTVRSKDDIMQSKSLPTSHREKFSEEESDRLLSRFRNSFVNLARPILSFAQPVPAEEFKILHANGLTSEAFTVWDRLEAPKDAAQLSMKELFAFIQHRFGYDTAENEADKVSLRIQSVSLGDDTAVCRFPAWS